jgi:hypothetical protein
MDNYQVYLRGDGSVIQVLRIGLLVMCHSLGASSYPEGTNFAPLEMVTLRKVSPMFFACPAV